MRTGKVIRFDEVRGYGFIAPDGGGEDVFVHANVLGDDKYVFGPGLRVEFEATDGDRGPKAYTVNLLNDRGPAVLAAPVTSPIFETRVAPPAPAAPVAAPPIAAPTPKAQPAQPNPFRTGPESTSIYQSLLGKSFGNSRKPAQPQVSCQKYFA